jgi:hypothetical protein
VSLVMAIVALLAFRVASNAGAIQRLKTRIGAYLLEIRLHSDDLRILLSDPWKIIGLNARYILHAMPPFLLILPPMLLAIVQIESRYAIRPLEPGEHTILTVAFRAGVDVMAPGLTLETSEGVQVETPPVRIPSLGEVSWRLRAVEKGEQWVRIVPPAGTDAEPATKLVWVDSSPKAMSRARTTRFAGLAALAEPAEQPLPRAGVFEEIRVGYRDRGSRPLGLSIPVWIFFVMSTAFGFLLKNRLGVTL